MRALGFNAHALGLTPQFLSPAAFEPVGESRHDPFRAVSQAECFFYMANTLLRDADTNSMAHSLEIRVPFLSRWFVDTVGGLPSDTKAPHGAPPKHLLRKATGSILPYDIFSRPKRGFSLPVGEWMFGPLQDECEAAIDSLAGCPVLPADAVRRLWEGYRSRQREMHWSRPLALVALGNYVQQMKGRSSSKPALC